MRCHPMGNTVLGARGVVMSDTPDPARRIAELEQALARERGRLRAFARRIVEARPAEWTWAAWENVGPLVEEAERLLERRCDDT